MITAAKFAPRMSTDLTSVLLNMATKLQDENYIDASVRLVSLSEAALRDMVMEADVRRFEDAKSNLDQDLTWLELMHCISNND